MDNKLTEDVYLKLVNKSKEYSDSLPVLIDLINKHFEIKLGE